jgi:hypothetical protein
LERIKQRLFQEYYQKKSWWGDELCIFDDDPGLASRPLVVRKALAVQKVCREMLGSFLVKFNEWVQLDNGHIEDHFSFGDLSQGGDPNLETTHLKMSNDLPYTYGQSQNHWLQNCIVDGFTPDGRDGPNELTHTVLDLINELELIGPLVSLRLHQDSPDPIVDTAAKWLARGGAEVLAPIGSELGPA